MSRLRLLIVLFFISGFAVAQESVSHLPALDEASRVFEEGKDYFSYQEPITLPPRKIIAFRFNSFLITIVVFALLPKTFLNFIVKLTAIAWY